MSDEPAIQHRAVTYTDQLLADGSAHRRFSDGREEWRVRGQGGVVHWRDNAGAQGTDELLGNGIIKRQYASGSVRYGREQGYGRTAWNDGTMTVNRTSFGGRVGAILAGIGAAGLLGAVVAPPLALSLEEEEQLRQAQARAQQQQPSDSAGGDGGDGGGPDDWGGGGDSGHGGHHHGGDDFG